MTYTDGHIPVLRGNVRVLQNRVLDGARIYLRHLGVRHVQRVSAVCDGRMGMRVLFLSAVLHRRPGSQEGGCSITKQFKESGETN